MSHPNPSDPASPLFYKHLFYATWVGDVTPSIEIDAFLVLPWHDDLSPEQEDDVIVREGVIRTHLTKEERRELHAFSLRRMVVDRPIGRGPLCVNASSRLTRSEMERYLNHISDEERAEFVDEAALGSSLR